MLAECALAIVVFAVYVHPEETSNRGVHGSRNHWWPPTIFEAIAPKVFDGDTSLAVNDAQLFVPTEDSVHPRNIDDQVLGADVCVAIAPS